VLQMLQTLFLNKSPKGNLIISLTKMNPRKKELSILTGNLLLKKHFQSILVVSLVPEIKKD
jgi:hypothetical protein